MADAANSTPVESEHSVAPNSPEDAANIELFNLIALALQKKGEKRTRGLHSDWLEGQIEDGKFTPPVQILPTMLIGTRTENALQSTFNRAIEKLGLTRLDVLQVDEDKFLLIDWSAPDVKEALTKSVM